MPRRRRIALLVVLALVVAVVGLTARLFVWPSVDQPSPADAIIVLGGDGYRFEKGAELAREGYAPVLVVSIDVFPGSPCSQDPVALDLVHTDLQCFIPDPFTTQGEAHQIAAMAAEHQWHHVIVVAGTAQDTRARVRIDRCFHGDLDVVTVQPDFKRSVRDVIYEWGALGKALVLQRSC